MDIKPLDWYSYTQLLFFCMVIIVANVDSFVFRKQLEKPKKKPKKSSNAKLASAKEQEARLAKDI